MHRKSEQTKKDFFFSFFFFPYLFHSRRCSGVLSALLASSDSKSFSGSGNVKDGVASDLLGLQELVSSDPGFQEDLFEQNVRSILESGVNGKDKKAAAAATRLLQLFEEKWSEGAKATPVRRGNNEAAKGSKIVTREISEKDKRSLVERLTELAPRQLVEALHVAKQAQPDLDMGLAPDLITLSIDDMTHECLVALIAFCGK